MILYFSQAYDWLIVLTWLFNKFYYKLYYIQTKSYFVNITTLQIQFFLKERFSTCDIVTPQ